MLAIKSFAYARFPQTCDLSRRLSSPVVAFALLLLLFSMADALATLRLLDSGGEELNPAMRWLLELGQAAFLAGKMAITVSGAFILLAFRNHRLFLPRLQVRSVLPVLAGVYGCLNVYEVVLLLRA